MTTGLSQGEFNIDRMCWLAGEGVHIITPLLSGNWRNNCPAFAKHANVERANKTDRQDRGLSCKNHAALAGISHRTMRRSSAANDPIHDDYL
ncbi:hypothetical protein MPL3356_340015 [Mesorhizobium plurifarium]|uniref:Uncharacterized protein n=1 Tax=Mesorhizobium plurifarium TaxID=69974 RepID=A0A090FPC0_MESPL|nr:hypothetical protein MPL3356_340015 [Mesorhizobium plurifarium]